jgi:hypothetical protein
LKAIDHGHSFRGTTWRASDLRKIDWVKDQQVFGLFPEFAAFVTRDEIQAILERAVEIQAKDVNDFLQQIPASWLLSPTESESLTEFLLQRAQYLRNSLADSIWPQSELISGQ